MIENQISRGGYIEAVGRRKTAIARVRISKLAKGITINKKPLEEYFSTPDLIKTVKQPFNEGEFHNELGVTVVVKGGGVAAQAEAVRHGLTRAFVSYNPEIQETLQRPRIPHQRSAQKRAKKVWVKEGTPCTAVEQAVISYKVATLE